MKVLIIDDDQLILDLVSSLLEAQGYTVSSESNGDAGIECAHAEQPNLIITDMSMPEMTGFEVIKNLKNDPATKNIPIMALTAAAQTADDRMEAYSEGADAYEIKPIDPKRLLGKIKKLVDGQ